MWVGVCVWVKWQGTWWLTLDVCGCSRRWHSHREVLSRVSTCFIPPQWDNRIKTSSAPLQHPPQDPSPIRLYPPFTHSHMHIHKYTHTHKHTHTHWGRWQHSVNSSWIYANREVLTMPDLHCWPSCCWNGTVVPPQMHRYLDLRSALFRLCLPLVLGPDRQTFRSWFPESLALVESGRMLKV